MPPSIMANSTVSFAKHTLSYPLYAADWDPYNRGYLVVGGGGGEGRSGVPNQITVLDVNNRAAIETALEIDLSRDEDSVSSVASLATKDGLITFAGINSSQKAQDAGKNEHFRSFGIRYPPRKRQKTDEKSIGDQGGITPIGQRGLFKPSKAPKKETYQRLVRLSPVQKRDAPGKRIGAIASSLASENEVIVFNATTALPDAADIITKISLPEKQEAADLDIAQTDENEFSIAYIDEHNIYEQTIKYDFDNKKAEKRPNGPRRAHQMPFPDSFQDPRSRPRFRCLRFLNSENLVTLVNKPNKSGAELRIYHLYPTGPALLMKEHKLPSRIKQASSIDVCALDADDDGNQQFVLAVAGQDISIEVYTINYQATTDTFSPFRSYLTLRNVHPSQMTKIAWSPFHTPVRAANPTNTSTTGTNGEPVTTPKPQHPGPQYIRLASVSFGNTVVVDTFPLSPLKPQDKDSRYVLSKPGDDLTFTILTGVVGALVILVLAFLYQSFQGGFSDSSVGPFNLLPQNVKDFLDMPAGAAYNRGAYSRITTNDASPTPTPTPDSLHSLFSTHQENSPDGAVVIRDVLEGEGVDLQTHPDKEAYLEKDVHAKHWHELEEHQQAYWKEKLVKAGHWAESEGDSVLKGVLWSTYAGLVGQVGGEILREL